MITYFPEKSLLLSCYINAGIHLIIFYKTSPIRNTVPQSAVCFPKSFACIVNKDVITHFFVQYSMLVAETSNYGQPPLGH